MMDKAVSEEIVPHTILFVIEITWFGLSLYITSCVCKWYKVSFNNWFNNKCNEANWVDVIRNKF